ncbi:MAG: carboxypeptidase regulatory-like domain-containing protein [Proteobacteria bacterium]|nr:carboxypeptidase regulatory-like domain-containing protein [Pseudomonadota bacterium]
MRALMFTTLLLATAIPRGARADNVGSITGTVLFEGDPPERATLRRDADAYCAKTDGKTPRLADEVVVTRGKLRDVLVRIKNGTPGLALKGPPATPVLLDQKDCMYAPHVVGVVAGQKLAVRNSDGTFHNVHGQIAGKNTWNKPHAPKDPDLALDTSPKADDVLEVRCDVHPWMKAYAVVQDHPFFAVTGDDGAFAIKGLPVGTYTLEAWHPTLGSKSMTVKIGTGKRGAITARFSYKP